MQPHAGRWATPIALVAVVLSLFFPARARASEAHAALARSSEWRKLVHYRTTFWSGLRSEVDGPTFYLAPQGRDDPEAELEATIAALSLPVRAGHEDEHAACRFPARRMWLAQVLEPEARARLQSPKCVGLARFQKLLDVESIAIVYVANALSNPASALGHTFMRLRKRRPPSTPESTPPEDLDHAVDFWAAVDTKNPLFYAVKGVTGLFRGYYRTQPFATEMQKYTEEDSRDMWEYDLDLTPHEIEMFTLHLWELSKPYIDYYYLTGNCSYYVLAAIEAAAPRLDVLSGLKPFIIPVDTIKPLTNTPGLVRAVHYRPSRTNQRHAWVVHADSARLTPWEKSPERGHGTTRFTIGAGSSTQYGTGFATAGFRLVLHDLLDAPDGEPELVQLQFLDTHLRYDLGRRKLTLDQLTFAEVMSLRPLRPGNLHLSWRVRAAGSRLHDRGCVAADCFAHGLDVAVGATLATHRDHLAVFLMADTYGLMSPRIDGVGGSFVRAGVGGYGGARVRMWHQMVLLLTGSYAYLPGSNLKTTFELRGGLRVPFSQHAAIGTDAVLQPEAFEAQLRSFIYF
jgi:hypothetical protein